MIAVGDTSGLIAAFNRSDPEHDACRAVLGSVGLLVVSPLTVTEIHQVTGSRAGRSAADTAVRMLVQRFRQTRAVLAEVGPDMLADALSLRARYADLDLDLVDAANAVVAAAYETDCVLTLDRRDFRVIRPLTRHRAFRLLPDEA
ncbi:PIN domain-containing protein [Streptomyces sp. RKND-216]|uniref:type II toxin-antitoxin system VapC family toxin n=1 Tax=Streptomyces sp. RKND-216 TaxID=2562581 RepID=UPI00109DB41E|nr:PIN domain-containing protein [Streptomyces sp. RKND-216]THA24401.1 PIN domain-containing protein [Streptomyces sp. RKND-216]